MIVKYSKGGHWMPSIPNQTCEHCGVIYTAHKRGQRFCSKSCGVTASTTRRVEHTERTCPGCGVKWSTYPSNPSRYCSKECIFESGAWIKPEDRPCEECGSIFRASFSKERGQWDKYCSNACRNGPRAPRAEKICARCGNAFEHYQSIKWGVTCSQECRDAYFLRDRHHAWRGGLVAQNERAFRRIDREGYKAKYDGEHRLIAARVIGRQIRRGEIVMCIDQDNNNLDPANLFIIPNYKELGLIKSGAVEWPKASNLEAYKIDGYVRPPVIIVVHEYEHRAPGQKGKARSRHPQADEIIERRRAGATLRELAASFDMSLSGMSGVVRHRL